MMYTYNLHNACEIFLDTVNRPIKGEDENQLDKVVFHYNQLFWSSFYTNTVFKRVQVYPNLQTSLNFSLSILR